MSCVLHLAIVGLLAGAALTLWNHSSLSSERSRIAVPQITLAPASVAQALGALGTRLGGALQHYNALLTWQAPSDSARALLYAYLGTQLLWLLAPASLISAYLAAFVLVPVYVHYARGPWLRLRAERVAPACKHLVDVARGHLDFVLQSGTLGKVSLLVTLAFAAYALSDYLPLAQMLKGAACGTLHAPVLLGPSHAPLPYPRTHAPTPLPSCSVVCYVVVLCDLCAFLAKAKED